MTVEEVVELVSMQIGDDLTTTVAHGINLKQALVQPQMISVIEREFRCGCLRDQKLEVWLVGQEPLSDGYKIIMRKDGTRFGLASSGFPNDNHPILVGWYGSLKSAFISM